MSQEHINNHKAYIQSWIAEIKNDPNELFKAINDATKISDYLIEKGNLKRFIREFAKVEDKKTEMDFEELERNFLANTDRDVSTFGWQVPMMDREEMITKVFKKKTGESFKDLEGMSLSKIEESIRSYLQDLIGSSDINVDIADVIITGSRARGFERFDSDLDVIVAYNGSFPEDSMFNLLHENDIRIGNVKVDFNPISLHKRISLADYLLESERYMYARIKELPYVPEKVAGYGLPNHKNTEVHQQELRRTGHVRR